MRPLWKPQPSAELSGQSLDTEMSLESVVQSLQTMNQTSVQTPLLPT